MFNSNYEDIREKKMVVIPFAGGSSQSFLNWNAVLENDVEIDVLDYPGHGRRLRENLICDFKKVIDDMEIQLNNIVDQPVILFGHSMGALIGGYVAAECHRKYGMEFKGIIISSCLSPQKLKDKKHVKPQDEQLEHYLMTERNIPKDIIKTREFKELLLPAIKNDLKVLREFQYRELQLPPCPIHCIYAEQDYDIDKESMKAWQECCSSPIKWHKIKGSHFYFEDYPKETFELIRNIVEML